MGQLGRAIDGFVKMQGVRSHSNGATAQYQTAERYVDDRPNQLVVSFCSDTDDIG